MYTVYPIINDSNLTMRSSVKDDKNYEHNNILLLICTHVDSCVVIVVRTIYLCIWKIYVYIPGIFPTCSLSMGLFGHNNLVNIVYCSLIGILVNVNTGCCVCINCLQCQTLLLNISLCEIGYVVVDIRLNVFVKYNLLQLIMYHQTHHLIIKLSFVNVFSKFSNTLSSICYRLASQGSSSGVGSKIIIVMDRVPQSSVYPIHIMYIPF